MGIRIQCLCIDARDPAAIASFWQSALGWRRTYEEDEVTPERPPSGRMTDFEPGIADALAAGRRPPSPTRT